MVVGVKKGAKILCFIRGFIQQKLDLYRYTHVQCGQSVQAHELHISTRTDSAVSFKPRAVLAILDDTNSADLRDAVSSASGLPSARNRHVCNLSAHSRLILQPHYHPLCPDASRAPPHNDIFFPASFNSKYHCAVPGTSGKPPVTPGTPEITRKPSAARKCTRTAQRCPTRVTSE